MIYCRTEVIPFECSMEFLHNNSTVESIRYSDGGCYDKFGECELGICSCSEDCVSFHWNFTTTVVQTNDSFGCKMRIYNSTSNSFHKVYTLAVYNGTGTMFYKASGSWIIYIRFFFTTNNLCSRRKCYIHQWIESTC